MNSLNSPNRDKNSKQLKNTVDSQQRDLKAQQKQFKLELNVTQHQLASQFDQISQQVQSYQSQIDGINNMTDEVNSQITLFENTIFQIEQFVKQRGSVPVDNGELSALCNQANRALGIMDEKWQIFCTNQGKGSHITLETHSPDKKCSKTTICSNTIEMYSIVLRQYYPNQNKLLNKNRYLMKQHCKTKQTPSCWKCCLLSNIKMILEMKL